MTHVALRLLLSVFLSPWSVVKAVFTSAHIYLGTFPEPVESRVQTSSAILLTAEMFLNETWLVFLLVRSLLSSSSVLQS